MFLVGIELAFCQFMAAIYCSAMVKTLLKSWMFDYVGQIVLVKEPKQKQV